MLERSTAKRCLLSFEEHQGWEDPIQDGNSTAKKFTKSACKGMAKVKAFFDTNILLYADDTNDVAKRHVANGLLESHFLENTGAVSIQVLQEYFYRATTKLKLDAATARSRT